MLAILCHSCHYYNHSSPSASAIRAVRMTGHWAVSPCPAEAGRWSLVSSRPRINIRGRAPGWTEVAAPRPDSRGYQPRTLQHTFPPPPNLQYMPPPSTSTSTSIPPAAKTIKSTHKVWPLEEQAHKHCMGLGSIKSLYRLQ